MLSLSALKSTVYALADLLPAPAHLLPTFGHNEDFAQPEIQQGSRGYHWVIVERGQEQERRTTFQLEELLYWVFEAITFSMACDYEAANRIENQDFRVILFRRQLELLQLLGPHFAQQCRVKMQKVLPGVKL